MARNALVSLLIFFLSLETVLSQTVTVPDPNIAGGSIVEVSTLDINNGLPTVSIIQSIPPDAAVPIPGVPTTTTSSTTLTTTPATPPPQAVPAVPAGPVGAPPPTTIPVGEGTTLFTYTTVVNGETQILEGTFTPTYNTLPPPPPATSGTILGISEFQSQFGTAAVGSAQSSRRLGLTTTNGVTIFTILCGVTAGALLTM